MDHTRMSKAVAAVTVIYLVVLVAWAIAIRPKAPDGTLPYQIAVLVFGFGAALGLAMMIAARPDATQRRLRDHGLEGWAVIGAVHEVGTPDRPVTEIDVVITVPGSDSYPGTVRRNESASSFEVGSTVSVTVDPEDRMRIWM